MGCSSTTDEPKHIYPKLNRRGNEVAPGTGIYSNNLYCGLFIGNPPLGGYGQCGPTGKQCSDCLGLVVNPQLEDYPLMNVPEIKTT